MPCLRNPATLARNRRLPIVGNVLKPPLNEARLDPCGKAGFRLQPGGQHICHCRAVRGSREWLGIYRDAALPTAQHPKQALLCRAITCLQQFRGDDGLADQGPGCATPECISAFTGDKHNIDGLRNQDGQNNKQDDLPGQAARPDKTPPGFARGGIHDCSTVPANL